MAYRSCPSIDYGGVNRHFGKSGNVISEKGDNKNNKDGVQRSNLLHSDRIVVSDSEVHQCELECPCGVLLVKECREENKSS